MKLRTSKNTDSAGSRIGRACVANRMRSRGTVPWLALTAMAMLLGLAGCLDQPTSAPATKLSPAGEGQDDPVLETAPKVEFDPAPDVGVGRQIGMLAPEIEGEDIQGNAFKLSDYRGQVVVLDFWGNW